MMLNVRDRSFQKQSQFRVLHFLGVITSSSLASSSPPRAVKAVHLSLQSTLLTPAKSASASATEKPQSSSASDSPLSLENLSVPHNDFFTAQFLVTFPTAGSYQGRPDARLNFQPFWSLNKFTHYCCHLFWKSIMCFWRGMVVTAADS